MEERIEIVKWLKDHGYNLFGSSVYSFAKRFDLETLKMFKEKFKAQKNIKE